MIWHKITNKNRYNKAEITFYCDFDLNRDKFGCYFLPKMALMMVLPILRSRPAREVGMPVRRENSRLALVMPKARFHEKVTPGSFTLEFKV